ncbi:MAG TPA: SDR family NAD(P)-dependent oxidoreductase [Spongiibacteraceae bacterium]|nr:SDR family NAD(P)-dependent oxidoreductase [Spongiibacteraceae bacterium]
MNLELFNFSGRVAIVTGGGTGIGAVTALQLAQRGADVVLAGRKPEPLETTAHKIRTETGRRCLTVPTDVTDPEQAAKLIEATIAEYGRLDILINNAGKATQSPLRTMAPAIWQKDVNLNLNAAFYVSQAAFPHLKTSALERNRQSAIVNISSLAGVNGTMGVGAYAAAKSGLQMFTRVASAEWGPHGIRVNAVACGMIATELAQAGWAKTGFDAIGASQAFPLRRPGKPEEIAQTVIFLISDAASYLTGETITVAGGPQLKGMIDV